MLLLLIVLYDISLQNIVWLLFWHLWTDFDVEMKFENVLIKLSSMHFIAGVSMQLKNIFQVKGNNP